MKRSAGLLLVCSLSLAGAVPGWGQTTRAAVETKDVLSMAAATALIVIPTLAIDHDSVTCVPCDRMTVPAFDRWAIGPQRRVPAIASDFIRNGIGLLSLVDFANEGRAGEIGMVASLESLVWSQAATFLLKHIVERKRPILYTEEGISVAADAKSQLSFPSGHASAAAAMATSYWLTRDSMGMNPVDDWRAWTLAGAAVSVAMLRVVSAKHFPTDVIAGLVIGVSGALIVHELRF